MVTGRGYFCYWIGFMDISLVIWLLVLLYGYWFGYIVIDLIIWLLVWLYGYWFG